MHGDCRKDRCTQAHRWGRPEGDAFAAAVRFAWQCTQAARRIIGSVETGAACRLLEKKDMAEDTRLRVRRCEGFLHQSCLPGWQCMAWLSPSSDADAAAREVLGPLLQRAMDGLLGRMHQFQVARSGEVKLEELLKMPLLLCPFVGFHGLPALRLQVNNGCKWSKLAKTALSVMESLAAEHQSRINENMQKPAYEDLLNFFEMTCDLIQHLQKEWHNMKEVQTYPYSPQVVCHLLEQGVVWANVLLTRFSNTTLPESYVKTHLCHLVSFSQGFGFPAGLPTFLRIPKPYTPTRKPLNPKPLPPKL